MKNLRSTFIQKLNSSTMQHNTTSSQPFAKLLVISCFLKRYLCFKPLYWIEKKIDPQCLIGKPKYKRFAKFVYKVCKWSL